MKILPKINIGKQAIKVVVFLSLTLFVWLIFSGAKTIIFKNVTYINIEEKDFLLYCAIPGVLCFFLGISWIGSLKSWDSENFISKIENRLEAVKLKVFIDELVKAKGWEQIGMYVIPDDKPTGGKK